MIGTLPVDCQSIPYDYGDGTTGPRQPVVCFPLAGRPVVLRLLTWFGVVQRVNVRTGRVQRVRDVGRNLDPSTLMDRTGRHLYVTPQKRTTRLVEVDLATGARRVLTHTRATWSVMPVCLTVDEQVLAVKGPLSPSEELLLTAVRVVRIDLRTADTVAASAVDRRDLPVQSARQGLVGCTDDGRWLIATHGRPEHLAALRTADTSTDHRIGPDRPIRRFAVVTDNSRA
jgi:hypothetical protein